MNKNISDITEKIQQLFSDCGFTETVINEKKNYIIDHKTYQRVDYNGTLGFIIESADSTEDAHNNRYEDSGVYNLELGDDLLKTIKKDLLEYYI